MLRTSITSSLCCRVFFVVTMAAATLLTLATFASLSSPAIAIGKPSYSKTSLAQLALGKVLDDAAPIFGVGDYVKFNTSTWMSKYPDSTLLGKSTIRPVALCMSR